MSTDPDNYDILCAAANREDVSGILKEAKSRGYTITEDIAHQLVSKYQTRSKVSNDVAVISNLLSLDDWGQ